MNAFFSVRFGQNFTYALLYKLSRKRTFCPVHKQSSRSLMPCCVPRCAAATSNTLTVRFPHDTNLQHRWRNLVKLGTGVTLADDGQQHEICMEHFARPEHWSYQEPVRFTDSSGNPVRVVICRLCHQAQHEREMFQLETRMAEKQLTTVIFDTLRIRLKPSEYSQMLCQECLAKIDLIRMIHFQYTILESSYQLMAKAKASLDVIELVKTDGEEINNLELGRANDHPEPKRTNSFSGSEQVTENPEPKEANDILGPDKTNIPEELVEYLEEVYYDNVLNSSTTQDVQITWEVADSDLEKPMALQRKDDNIPTTSRPKRKYVRTQPKKPKPPKRSVTLLIESSRTCYICKTRFPQREELMAHLLDNHTTPEGYKCVECNDKPFETVVVYNIHLKYHDASERKYKCNFCALRFVKKDTVTRHENRYHGTNHKIPEYPKPQNKPTVQCELCGKLLFRSAMERHMQVHKGEVQCSICNRTVPSTSHLNIHMMHHINMNPFQCTSCEKSYATKHGLKTHVIKIHDKKHAFCCRVCKETFYSRTELRHHARDVHQIQSDIHGSRLRFKCQLCPEVPKLKSELEAHVEACHADERYPYLTCKLCPGLKFIAKEPLSMHRYTKHRSQPYIRPERRRALEQKQRKEVEHSQCDDERGED